MLVDKVDIKVTAGNGGSGLASFLHEKFKPFGGPDGGDGGKGGDVYLLADSNLESLINFRHRRSFKADRGGGGRKNKMKGENAADLIITVPLGTSVYVKEDGRELLIADLQKNGQKAIVARGGKGGKGNPHFATATRKAPKHFQQGEAGEERELTLKLAMVTDACIIGLPNSGKSTLLAAISNARPPAADYPFTTVEPTPGAVDDGRDSLIWTELPALVEGAHLGKGLSNSFLSHAERAGVLVYLLDAGSEDVARDLRCLREEVKQSGRKLEEKKSIIAVNKIDSVDSARLDSISRALGAETEVVMISVLERKGLDILISAVHNLIRQERAKEREKALPEMVFRPKPVDRRD